MNLLDGIITTKTMLELSREVVKYVDNKKKAKPNLEDKDFDISIRLEESGNMFCCTARIKVKV